MYIQWGQILQVQVFTLPRDRSHPKSRGSTYEVNPMGTLLEAKNIDKIFEASKRITEAIHNLGVQRVEVVLKIDSRKDKDSKLEEKLESLKKYLKAS